MQYNKATMPAKDIYHDTVKNSLIEDGIIRLVTFDTLKQEIIRWIH
ncbi:XisH family protein [Desmonostoc muscorum LEGE 12446]|uniref:Uncharacterized protein n=1 Tax=Desmonostoc muscorum LEGE 12446 TaxID=1828758 RepID=A0A8J7D2C3_DESMC|nr:hypothetical protein [Desmonostoc muscorum]MCF2150441.1 XisH family protein [Desmonostoc muscorum LEGE 12446]